MTPILIDTGPSPYGWHSIAQFLRCETAWFHERREKAAGHESFREPLVRGSIGHAGLAHHYARAVAVSLGRDPERFHPPTDAMALVARKFGEVGARMLPEALRGFHAHQRAYAVDRDETIGIERLLETQFTDDAGISWPYTARADRVVRNRDTGKVWIHDHKFVGRVEDKVFKRYALSGQFAGLAHLGLRYYGDNFAGIVLNVVGCQDQQCGRRQVEPAPWAVQRFPWIVCDARRRMKEADRKPLALLPMALNETVCITPYGPCDFFDRCRWGH